MLAHLEVLTTAVLVVSTILFIASTVPFLELDPRGYELIISGYLALEFGLKNVLYPSTSKLVMFVDVMSFAPNLVDIAIMPFMGSVYLSQTFAMLRLFRLIRVSKLVIDIHPETELILECMGQAVVDSLPTMSALLVLVFLGLLMGSTLIYFAELSGWRGRESPLNSIPMASWSVVEMISTVGLGDVAPITPLGRLIGGCLMLCAMALVAFPSIILANNFQKLFEQRRAILIPSSTDAEA